MSIHDVRQEMLDLRSFGELAFYCVLARGGPEMPPSMLRNMAKTLHGILSEFEPSEAANTALADAYVAARHRAEAIGDDVSDWPADCPATLDQLRNQLKSICRRT